MGDDVYVVVKSDKVDGVVPALGHRERVGRKLVIVGAGNVGLHLPQQLRHVSPNVDIKIIERDQERAKYVSNELGGAVVVLHGDALDQELLEEARVGLAETIVTVTNDDETNIFASVIAKEIGCKRAITLVNKSKDRR